MNALACAQNNWLGRMLGQVPYFRDRLMADKMFAFKVGAEVTIDMGEFSLIWEACAHART